MDAVVDACSSHVQWYRIGGEEYVTHESSLLTHMSD